MRQTWKPMVTLLAVALAAGLLPVAVASSAEAATRCRTHWGSSVKKLADAVGGPITGVRAGRRGCFDRLVIDLKGTAPGYRVGYVSDARIGVPLRGRTQLAVTVESSRFQVGQC